MRRAPILPEIVRQHAEMAAFLWTVYDHALQFPDENPELDDERMARLVRRLDAHVDALRIAGEEGRRIAQQRFEAYPEAGELWLVRMLRPEAGNIAVADLNLERVRAFIAANLPS
jgi:hypothetical protein